MTIVESFYVFLNMTLRKFDVVIEIFYSGFWEKLGEYLEKIKLVTK